MAKAYIVRIAEEVIDDEGMEAMYDQVQDILDRAGGKVLVRGGAIHSMNDGSTPPPRIMVAEFDSVAAARSLFDDPEYDRLANLRQQLITASVFIVEGV
ncbi:MAG: DUF1330 domain-containing protein [Chloroflexi bacterium]|nr:DUF1330 domain-containing protein [Chloroflexota bacterium]MYD48267.1 DUF1330 domain-containing protein [Chloroflexota bacterium]